MVLADLPSSITYSPILSPVNLGWSLEANCTTASRYLKSFEEAGILEHVAYRKYQTYAHRDLIEVTNG